MVIFCADKFVGSRPYPNCATWEADPFTPEWKQFSVNSPFSEPVHFYEYLDQESIEYQVLLTQDAPIGSIYPISISFFDFDIDWFTKVKQDFKVGREMDYSFKYDWQGSGKWNE